MEWWPQIAQLIYLLGVLGAVVGAMAYSLIRFDEAKAVLTRFVLISMAALIGVQALVSLLAIWLASRDLLSASSATILHLNWLTIILALAAVPGALVLSPLRPDPPLPRQELKRLLVFGVLGTLVVSWSLNLWIVLNEEHFVVNEALLQLISDPAGLPLFVPIALMAGVVEEVLFRGAMQGGLARLRLIGEKWGPIVVTSLFFTAGHAGVLEPHGFKEAQIFVVSLIFGWMRYRAGLGASILAHLVLNGTTVLAEALMRL